MKLVLALIRREFCECKRGVEDKLTFLTDEAGRVEKDLKIE